MLLSQWVKVRHTLFRDAAIYILPIVLPLLLPIVLPIAYCIAPSWCRLVLSDPSQMNQAGPAQDPAADAASQVNTALKHNRIQ